LSDQTADTYRLLRKYQHNMRLQGEEKARVQMEKVEPAIEASVKLWDALFMQ
jgi:glutamate-ammonia-ligase adenylyltransferase